MEDYVRNHLKALPGTIAEFNKIGGFKQPDSFIVKNPDSDRSHYIPVDVFTSPDHTLSGTFYSDLDHSELISLGDLIEISKKSATKFHCNLFKGDKFKHFLAKFNLNLFWQNSWKRQQYCLLA